MAVRWLETDSLSNQNIASALAIGAYTADADRLIVCDVSVDQAAGSGDYVMYVTRQIAGAGSHYVMLPKTTMTAAAGETAIAGQSGMISVRSGDVLTVYVDGLAGDTTTPDTTVRWFEVAALRPTTADRTLDVSATNEVSANLTAIEGVSNFIHNLNVFLEEGTIAGNLLEVDVSELRGQVQSAIDLVDFADTGYDPLTHTVGGLGTGAITSGSFATGAITAAAIAADAIGASELAADAVAEIADAVWDEALSGHTTDGTTGDRLGDIVTTTVTAVSAVDGGTLSVYQGVTYEGTVSGLTIPAGWTAVYLTVKRNVGEADSAAIVQIIESNPGVGTDGLLRLNAAAGTAGQASLTVNASAGTVAIWIADNATDDLALATGLVWALKALESDGDSTLLATGTQNVLGQAALTV